MRCAMLLVFSAVSALAVTACALDPDVTRLDDDPLAAPGDPTIRLTRPVPGSVFTNAQTVALEASVSGAVQSVDFLVDGVLVKTDATAPFTASWPIANGYDAGARELTAMAHTARGTRSSPPVPVSVEFRAPKITGPITTSDGRIFDASGEVRLFGIGFAGLAEGNTGGTDFYPPPEGSPNLTNHYDWIEEQGYNVVRLRISWSNMEPTDNGTTTRTWNHDFEDALRDVVGKYRARGVAVVLQMFPQDWACEFTAAAKGCPPTDGPGLPSWLFSDAMRADPDLDLDRVKAEFFANIKPTGVAYRSTPFRRFRDFWLHVVETVPPAEYPNVIGVDLWNEPYPIDLDGDPVHYTSYTLQEVTFNAIYTSTIPGASALAAVVEDAGDYAAVANDFSDTTFVGRDPTSTANWLNKKIIYTNHTYNDYWTNPAYGPTGWSGCNAGTLEGLTNVLAYLDGWADPPPLWTSEADGMAFAAVRYAGSDPKECADVEWDGSTPGDGSTGGDAMVEMMTWFREKGVSYAHGRYDHGAHGLFDGDGNLTADGAIYAELMKGGM